MKAQPVINVPISWTTIKTIYSSVVRWVQKNGEIQMTEHIVWLKVSAADPTDDIDVLVTIKGSKTSLPAVFVAPGSNQEPGFYTDRTYTHQLENVTHWADMPGPAVGE